MVRPGSAKLLRQPRTAHKHDGASPGLVPILYDVCKGRSQELAQNQGLLLNDFDVQMSEAHSFKSGNPNASAFFHHYRAIDIPQGPPPFLSTTRLGSLFPGIPYPNQATHGPSKSNNPIIKVGVTQGRSWDSEVAEVREKLEIRGVQFPVEAGQHPLPDRLQKGHT